jgi:hypothetical protein
MTRWIGGPLFDACFFFGSGLVALAAGLVMLAAPSTVLPLWFAWLLLIEGPHLCATWQRTYLDASWRRERARLMWASLLWLLPGPLLLLATWLSGRPEPFLLFLGAVALWSFHHAVRQHHGILSIYQRLAKVGPAARAADKWLLHAILWTAFVLLIVAHPANGVRDMLGDLATGLVTGIALLLGAAMIAWAALLVSRWRRGDPLAPGLFALVVATGTTLFSLLVVGLHEPLLAHPRTVEQVFLAATIVSGTLHGLQYIGIVIATERRRATHGAPLAAYTVMVAASLLYVWLNLARGGAPVGAAPGAPTAQMFLALYWGLFCHHFWLDQKIWRPSRDARLRSDLGLEAA